MEECSYCFFLKTEISFVEIRIEMAIRSASDKLLNTMISLLKECIRYKECSICKQVTKQENPQQNLNSLSFCRYSALPL